MVVFKNSHQQWNVSPHFATKNAWWSKEAGASHAIIPKKMENIMDCHFFRSNLHLFWEEKNSIRIIIMCIHFPYGFERPESWTKFAEGVGGGATFTSAHLFFAVLHGIG